MDKQEKIQCKCFGHWFIKNLVAKIVHVYYAKVAHNLKGTKEEIEKEEAAIIKSRQKCESALPRAKKKKAEPLKTKKTIKHAHDQGRK